MRTLIVITEKTNSQEILDINMNKFQLHNTTHAMLREARSKVLESLAADSATNNLDAVLKTAYTDNLIEELDLDIQ